MTYDRVTESSQRHCRAISRHVVLSKASCLREGDATSVSRVHPVISRTHTRTHLHSKGNSIKPKRILSLSLSLSATIAKERNRNKREGRWKGTEIVEVTAKEEQEATGQTWTRRGTSSRAMEVVAIRWCATSSKEGEGAVLPRGGILR